MQRGAVSWIFALLLGCGGGSAKAPVPPPPPPPVAAAPPATAASADAAYDAKQWKACAEQWMAVAKAPGAKDPSNSLYNAACCYAQDGQADRAFEALAAATDGGYRSVEHMEADTDLTSLHADPRWPKAIAAVQKAIAVWELTLKDPALRRELLAMIEKDQEVRMRWIDAMKRKDKVADAAISKEMAAIDRADTDRLKAVVAKMGWPGKSAVGEDGAHAAWLLVQHADQDRAFQRDVLARMQPLSGTEVSAIDYAYLYDRVAVGEKRPQRYGTQFDNGNPAPIEDAEHVDERRKAIGLGTMDEYRAQMKKMYGP